LTGLPVVMRTSQGIARNVIRLPMAAIASVAMSPIKPVRP